MRESQILRLQNGTRNADLCNNSLDCDSEAFVLYGLLDRDSPISYYLGVPHNVFKPVNNLGFLLAKAGQSWNDLLYSKFCEAGYSDVRPAYGSILMPLFEEDGLQIGELGRRAQLSKQTMTTMIDVMEQRKIISRTRDPLDARAFRIYLTKRSRRFKIVAAKVLREMDRATELHLNKHQISALKTILRVLMNLSSVNAAVSDNKARAGARRAKANRST